jgi:hypothetical protein
MSNVASAIFEADEDPTCKGVTAETADSEPEETRASETEDGFSCEAVQFPAPDSGQEASTPGDRLDRNDELEDDELEDATSEVNQWTVVSHDATDPHSGEQALAEDRAAFRAEQRPRSVAELSTASPWHGPPLAVDRPPEWVKQRWSDQGEDEDLTRAGFTESTLLQRSESSQMSTSRGGDRHSHLALRATRRSAAERRRASPKSRSRAFSSIPEECIQTQSEVRSKACGEKKEISRSHWKLKELQLIFWRIECHHQL